MTAAEAIFLPFIFWGAVAAVFQLLCRK